MTFSKILCATDFSAGAQSALRVATRISNAAGAELVIAHAWQVPTAFGDLPVPSEISDELTNDAVRGLETAVRDAKAIGAKHVASRLLAGASSNAILEALVDPTFDLVVVGTHGRTGLSRVLLGSVAEKVVRHSPCSVLVVRPDDKPAPFTHVLCPIDFSESSRFAQELAGALAQLDGATLTLLNVLEITFAYTGRAPANYIQLLERSSKELLDKAAAQVRTNPPVPVTKRSAIGSPGGETLALVHGDRSIDLVVMGSHGRTGIKRLLLGSVAEKVVRHARCPVLVARTRD